MDHQSQRGRSPSAGRPAHIQQSHSHSPSPAPYQSGDPSTDLGMPLDQSAAAAQQSFTGTADPNVDAFAGNSFFDPNAATSFTSQNPSEYLSPNLNDGDFSLFPPAGQGDQYSNAPLFEQNTLNPNDIASMASPQPHSSPTPPHLFTDAQQQVGSAHQSPSFAQHQFPSPTMGPVHHSRNASHTSHTSLGPEAALLPNQMGDWSQPQFQGHRRSPSAHSDVSSVSPSPNMVSSDSFDDGSGHSPLQRASDGSLYQDVLGIGSFSISDPAVSSPASHGRSPSHSPAISPRLHPQQMPNMNPQGYGLAPPGGYGDPTEYSAFQVPSEVFPNLQQANGADMSQMAPPSINIDYAPTNSKTGVYEGSKEMIDQDSLTPPERGRQRARQRAVTDPFHPSGGMLGRPQNQPQSHSQSPSLGSAASPRSDVSRSLSPHSGTSPSRRRQSTSSVPNNVIALRLADPEFQSSQDAGGAKRVQKHPATFQCTLCPKRFTRAYNLRSHLRTHTDERPFTCTVCGKAFARQHDRKRHESLHSGEKKFVCKGDLKAGGQWGCGRRFARADALGRHFRSEAGRICIKPLLDEEMVERQRQWSDQQMQQQQQNVNLAPQNLGVDPSSGYPMESGGNFVLPAALLAQYPALAQMSWSGPEMGGIDEDVSGRSSFDASDFDDGDEAGYVSGPGTGYGEGSMGQNFGEMGYTSDMGGR